MVSTHHEDLECYYQRLVMGRQVIYDFGKLP